MRTKEPAIALFRGINVGGHNLLPMKELVIMLEELGCEAVKTYIQSGNVVFQREISDVKEFAERICATINKAKGFAPKALLLSRQELEEAISNNPFDSGNGKNLHFYFLEDNPTQPNLEKLESLKRESEAFELKGRIFYLFAPEGIGRSKLAANVEKCMGVPVTARNWNTISKLKAMIDPL